jgi:catechol 2,3-dioxygenase-like lactoylglutathione lyase family enzyme
MTSTSPKTAGVHHAGLTVPDLSAARSFFIDALGFSQVGERPDYPAAFLSDGACLVTLWQAEDPAEAVPFDRRRVIGLHHLALRVADGESLDALGRALGARSDVTIEFPPEPLGSGPTRHMMLTIPGGIRLELIAPAR